MNNLSPIFAVLTPFDEHGQIDFPAFADSLHFMTSCEVPTILVGGTTGEFSSMTNQERMDLLEAARKNFNGKVIAHVSTTCASDMQQLVAHAHEFADGLLALPAYYFAKQKTDGMLNFFRLGFAEAKLPVYLYNFPLHTQFTITIELVQQLKKVCPLLAGIKDSRGDVDLAKDFLQDDFEVYLGSDSKVFKARQEGLTGSVTGSGNPFPEYMVQITSAFQQGQIEQAKTIQSEYDKWTTFRKTLSDDQIAVAKCALGMRVDGFSDRVRPPLEQITKQSQEKIAEFVSVILKESEVLKPD